MGHSVLYIAFGIVALWLLGEVLLQYKARLRWRALAFAGFMGVVAGVAMHQVAIIVLGALAFGIGQSFVTLSYKRGFAAGWALRGGPLADRLRRGEPPRSAPVLQVSAIEEDDLAGAPAVGPDGGQDRIADPETARAQDVYQPMPLHEDSGEYPLYDGAPGYTADPYATRGHGGYGAPYQDPAGWSPDPQPAQPAAASPYGDSGGYGYGGGQGDGYGWTPDPAAAGHDYSGYAPQQPAGYDYGQGGYPQPAAGYDQGAPHTTGDWTPQPPAADPYGYGYAPADGQQPYVPPQQPYDPGAYPQQPPGYDPQQQPYGQQPEQQPQYADPYDPYRY
jgi:hypothetical protein